MDEPAQQLDFEYAVLRAIWDAPSVLDSVRSILQSDMFYRPDNSGIYRAMLSLHDRGSPIDLLTVSEEAARLGLTDEHTVHLTWVAGGECCASPANAVYYAEKVREAWAKRKLAAMCARAVNDLANSTLLDIKARIERELEELLPPRNDAGPTLEDLCNEVLDAWDVDTPRMPFWIMPPAENVQHLVPGDLHVVGASPSVGKTAVLTQAAMTTAKAGFRVLFASYEMSAVSIWRRMVSQETGMPMSVVQEGPTRAQGAIISNAMQSMLRLPMVIRKPGTSDIHGLIALIEATRPDVACVDYMQLVRGKGDNRVQQVGYVAQSLKDVAMRLPCVVVAASQLSRAAFADSSNRPELHHLRESGEIEAVADSIMLLWRDRKEEIVDGHYAMRYVRMAKNRNGPTWEKRSRFNLRCAKWDCGEETP